MEMLGHLFLLVLFQAVASRYAQPQPLYTEDLSQAVSSWNGRNIPIGARFPLSHRFYGQFPVYGRILMPGNNGPVQFRFAKDEPLLDEIIKNRVGALQQFQYSFNKLLEDIGNTATSFLSQDSVLGGISRKSLFDVSIVDTGNILVSDMRQLKDSISQLYRNFIEDVHDFINYISKKRYLGLEDLLRNAISGFSGFSGIMRLLA